MSLKREDRMYGSKRRGTVGEYLSEILEEHDIPRGEGIIDEVCEVVSDYKNTDGWKWRMSELLRGALYLVLKRRGMPRDATNLAESHEHRNIIYRRWKEIARTIGDPIEPFVAEEWFPRVKDLIEKNLMELPDDIVDKAEELYKELKEMNNFGIASGQSPKSFVVSVFYYVLKSEGYDIRVKDMVEVTDVTKHTLKDNLEKIKKYYP